MPQRSKRWLLAGAVSLVLFLGLRVGLHAWATESPHVQGTVHRHGTGDGPLVVVLHGMGGPGSVKALVEAIPSAPGLANARVLAPAYASAPHVNVSPELLALSLYHAVNRAAGQGPVILVGHSMGGMLLRYAYLKALEEQRPWAEQTRIVLLASINRGWTIKIADKLWHQVLLRAGNLLLPALGMGDLYAQLRRGSIFVADVRLRWMLAMRALAQDSRRQVPSVVQVRGLDDTVARKEDTADLEAAPSFRRVELGDTDHAAVLQFDGEVGAERKQVLLQEIAGIPSTNGAASVATPACAHPDPDVQTVILAVHGIRTAGAWTQAFREQVQRDAADTNPRTRLLPRRTEAIPVDYGWFPMVPFLMGAARQTKLRYFIDAYTEAVACFPNANISAFAHSNGTFVVAHAMQQVSAIKLHRLALAGSVLPQAFEWSALSGRVGKVANYRANEDLIVGIFPHLFERFSSEAELGAAGLWGFETPAPFVYTLQPVHGGHSAVVDSEKHRREVSRFLADEGESSSHWYFALTHRQPIPTHVEALSRLCWMLWGLIVFALALVTWFCLWLRRIYAGAAHPLNVVARYAVHGAWVILLAIAFQY